MHTSSSLTIARMLLGITGAWAIAVSGQSRRLTRLTQRYESRLRRHRRIGGIRSDEIPISASLRPALAPPPPPPPSKVNTLASTRNLDEMEGSRQRRRWAAPCRAPVYVAALAAVCCGPCSSVPVAAFSPQGLLARPPASAGSPGGRARSAGPRPPPHRRGAIPAPPPPPGGSHGARCAPLHVSAAAAALPAIAACASGVLGHGLRTFCASWKTFSLVPVIAAFVGWFTNYLAVKMIFYPIKWRGIPIKKVEGEPLGLIGWQGIVPAKAAKMTDSMVDVTINELLCMDEVIQRLDPERVADILLPEVPKLVQPIVEDVVPDNLRPLAKNVLKARQGSFQYGLKVAVSRMFLVNLTRAIQRDVRKVLNVQNCVREQVMSDRSLLGKLFQRTGGVELSFLVDSGLWVGALLGVVQMIVALYWDNPWTLSVGGAIVGLATNWIALKLIFEPVMPRPFGPFVLQGLFIRRQKGVAKDFADFFANNILTSRQLWNSILTDPQTSPVFAGLFERNLKDLVRKSTGGLVRLEDSPGLASAVARATAALPMYLEDLHPYVDAELEIERTLRTEMGAMSPQRFERVLHPIFEEDELTLILAGAFLGLLAGLVQQGLASGRILLPTITFHTAPRLALVAFGAVLPLLYNKLMLIYDFNLDYIWRYLLRAKEKAKNKAKKARGERKARKLARRARTV